ncbi:MFS transporter [Dactylosporangium cerinum]|uniref:MFS transporter n=1 Tax=Dactylosporangium cerinum TaxID=1434730 RepID=A0ABV9W198_9ACTN
MRRERAGLLLAAVVGAEFMLQLDGTIVAVALPDLQRELGLSTGALTWVVNGFLLAFGGGLLVAGRVGDLLGHRRAFLAGIALLTAGSALAGLAPATGWLIGGRVVQGAGAALAGPAGLALLSLSFDAERRERALGVYATVTGLAAGAGMLLGGLLTWAGDWRWTLLVNVPVGLVVLVLSARLVPARAAGTAGGRLDVAGALLSASGTTALVFGFVRAAGHGWRDTTAVSALGFAVLALAVLAVTQRRVSDPLLPPRVFADRGRAGAFAALVLLAFVLTGFLFFLTLLLQRVFDLDPLRTGLGFLPFGLALMLAARTAPALLRRMRPQLLAVCGLLLVGAAMLILSRVGAGSGYLTAVLGPEILLGLGAGATIVPLNVIVLASTGPADVGVTSGVLQAALSIGGSLGLAVLLSVSAGADGIAGGVARAFLGGALAAALAVLVAAAVWFTPSGRTPEATEDLAELSDQEATA